MLIMKAEVIKTRNQFGGILCLVFRHRQIVFSTLDDGFGMDRIRDWAKPNRFEIV